MTVPALEVADRIGRRLVQAAVRQDGLRTWATESGPAAGSLYRGTAGIALFLAELARCTESAETADAAAGAARHALAWAEALPPRQDGLFSGRLGAAYAAARAGVLLERDDLLAGARTLARHVASSPLPQGNDVVDGVAGAVLGLLALEPLLGGDETRAAVPRLGRELVRRAVPEPWGWSWPAGDETRYARNLLGYAHGASGVGHALLELFASTGDAAFGHAAEQAWLYERRFLSPAGNWPDFRHPAAAGAAREFPYAPRYTCAWCHGAGGIALARARALTLLGRPVYRAELEAALRAVRARLDEPGGSFSLCHGTAGTAEVLLEAAAALGAPGLRREAEAAGEGGWERFERAGVPWPSGARGGGPEPGLMLGDAGIGHFYLRLYDASVPSILLLRGAAAAPPAPPGARDPAVLPLRIRAVNEHFGGTLAALARLAPGRAPLELADAGPAPDAHLAWLALSRRVEGEADPTLGPLLADAFAVERARYEMAMGAIDRGEEEWTRGSGGADGAGGDGGWVRLADTARLVIAGHDWERWVVETAPGGAAEPPSPAPTAWLLARSGNRVRAHRLAPLAAAVLEALRAPRRPSEVADAVAAAFPPGAAPPPEALRPRVDDQLARLEALGAVVRDAAPPLDRHLDRLAAFTAGAEPPAAVRARWRIVRRLETARRLVDGPDRMLALLAARAMPPELGAMLRAVHAEPLFAHLLRRSSEARTPDERLAALRALVDALERSFRDDALLVEA